MYVCAPAARPLKFTGLLAAAYDAPSSFPSNVRLPAAVTLSVPVNVIAAAVLLVNAAGLPVIVVCGAVTSTVHVTLAGVASTFPA